MSHVNSKEKDWHEWQQPLEEVETQIRYFSDPGDLVVDPCGGGFTTAVACLRQNRRCISCDCDESYVANGQQRLAQELERRGKNLEDLRIWIEDLTDMGGSQGGVESLWEEHSGLSKEQLQRYISSLSENHQTMWQSLPA